MMIESALLDQVLARVAAATGADAYGDGLKAWLRGEFPDVRFTVCDADDITVRLPPAASSANCSLYYIGSGEHCLKLSNDAADASGVVVAVHDEDD
jgi:hypothetical protein